MHDSAPRYVPDRLLCQGITLFGDRRTAPIRHFYRLSFVRRGAACHSKTADEPAAQLLPNIMDFEWADFSYQPVTPGNAGLIVFPVLAALCECRVLPLAC
ncbi:MAG: hypothetical protein FD165_1620 [Gammaproteobacteria bacterium]|nr:MAG: hypothetical protein FD165_1620 [Gammaproteobacteria bacterium]